MIEALGSLIVKVQIYIHTCNPIIHPIEPYTTRIAKLRRRNPEYSVAVLDIVYRYLLETETAPLHRNIRRTSALLLFIPGRARFRKSPPP